MGRIRLFGDDNGGESRVRPKKIYILKFVKYLSINYFRLTEHSIHTVYSMNVQCLRNYDDK
jgi:hypothetical protein